MKTKLNTKNVLAKGFSLVEMLVVIAVIGVIAAIAIPSIGSITSSAGTAAAKRNAQSIASIYASGVAAGIVWGGSDKAAAIHNVTLGKTAMGADFRVDGLSSTDEDNAAAYLTDSLSYKPN